MNFKKLQNNYSYCLVTFTSLFTDYKIINPVNSLLMNMIMTNVIISSYESITK